MPTFCDRLANTDIEALEAIRSACHRLLPNWQSPERYFIQRSEISGALTKLIRAEHIHALFGEAYEDPRIMRQLAKDGGAKLAGDLYADTLSPSDDYIAMMRRNVSLIAATVSVADTR